MPGYQSDEIFKNQKFTKNELVKEYEFCEFIRCDFSEADLSEVIFTNCEFKECNLSLANLTQTLFKKADFINCKMLGLRFDVCSEFGFSVSFENCLLNNSSFYQKKVANTVLRNCSLQECDFVNCDLSGAVFSGSDLAGAVFENTQLQKTDFRTAKNYQINPEINNIKNARFSLSGISGLLQQYGIEVEIG